MEVSSKDLSKPDNSKESCTDIPSRELFYHAQHYLSGQNLSTGTDVFGYNYQAHTFRGFYANLYAGEIGLPPYQGEDEQYLTDNPGAQENTFFMENYWPYRNDMLIMTWNDTWQSNKDCDGDGKLDIAQNTIGSGAWELFQSSGTYEDLNGNACQWQLKFKIMAVPFGAEKIDEVWYDENGNELGQNFYDQWMITQKQVIDPCGQLEEDSYRSPHRVGFGNR